jgi:hypothetical protein
MLDKYLQEIQSDSEDEIYDKYREKVNSLEGINPHPICDMYNFKCKLHVSGSFSNAPDGSIVYGLCDAVYNLKLSNHVVETAKNVLPSIKNKKLIQIIKHEIQEYEKYIMSSEDYISHCLTGEAFKEDRFGNKNPESFVTRYKKCSEIYKIECEKAFDKLFEKKLKNYNLHEIQNYNKNISKCADLINDVWKLPGCDVDHYPETNDLHAICGGVCTIKFNERKIKELSKKKVTPQITQEINKLKEEISKEKGKVYYFLTHSYHDPWQQNFNAKYRKCLGSFLRAVEKIA